MHSTIHIITAITIMKSIGGGVDIVIVDVLACTADDADAGADVEERSRARRLA